MTPTSWTQVVVSVRHEAAQEFDGVASAPHSFQTPHRGYQSGNPCRGKERPLIGDVSCASRVRDRCESGLGRAVALALATSGADMVVNYVSDGAAAEEVAHQIEAAGQRA